MKREIKFRAWDKPSKKMLFPEEMVIKKDGYDCVFKVNGIRFSESDELNGEIMQFTGLKDKNGKEIYEGDIVTGDRNGTLDEIIFSDGCFCLKNAWIWYEATYWGDEIEVMGNIYENPELLK